MGQLVSLQLGMNENNVSDDDPSVRGGGSGGGGGGDGGEGGGGGSGESGWGGGTTKYLGDEGVEDPLLPPA